MLSQVFHFKWLTASDTVDLICVQHLDDQSRWRSVATFDILADFARFLLLLQILVVELHVQAPVAVQLAAISIIAFDG